MDWYWVWRSSRFRIGAIIGSVLIFLIILITILSVTLTNNLTPLEKAEKLLAEIILFDGHNELPTSIRSIVQNDLRRFNFSQNLSEVEEWESLSHHYSRTDLYRLRIGNVKAQFWVARADCESQFKDAVEITLEQIDLIKRLVSNYSSDLALVTSYDELIEAVEEEKIASLITVCCGHSIQFSFAILRLYYELGVRAMTIVPSTCSTSWADSAAVNSVNMSTRQRPYNNGVSPFGEQIIYEMNRLGMIIDLSESSVGTMKEILILSRAPVIFSHSAARALCDNEKNIPDDVLKLVRQRDALVMVTFYPNLIKCDHGQLNATITDIVDHIEHIRNRTTIDNVGIGSDFDAVQVATEGLEDVSKFPNLFAALIDTGRWSDSDLEKLAGQNMLRILQEVEHERDKMKDVGPRQSWIRLADLKKIGYDGTCKSSAPIEQQTVAPYDFGKFVMPRNGK